MTNPIISVRHCYWTSNQHKIEKKYHKKQCKIMTCLQCNTVLNKGERVSAHVEKEDGSMGLVITCNPCNSRNPHPKQGIFPVTDDKCRYLNVPAVKFFDLNTKSPQWIGHSKIYGQKKTSDLWKSEFNNFGSHPENDSDEHLSDGVVALLTGFVLLALANVFNIKQ